MHATTESRTARQRFIKRGKTWLWLRPERVGIVTLECGYYKAEAYRTSDGSRVYLCHFAYVDSAKDAVRVACAQDGDEDQ